MKGLETTYEGRYADPGDRLSESMVTVRIPSTEGLPSVFYPLPLRLDLANHSPTGFSWGYAGSGPAQLALALLVDFTEDERLSLKIYQEFKDRCIAKMPMEIGFKFTGEFLKKTIELILSSPHHSTTPSWLKEGQLP